MYTENAVYSALLATYIPAEEVAKGKYIVKHDWLESTIIESGQFSYTLDPVKMDLTHSVVCCKMSAGHGNNASCISKIGECTPDSLWTENDRLFPVTVAANRAFDRAAIRLLRLNSPYVYSDKEVRPEMFRANIPSAAPSPRPQEAPYSTTVKKEDFNEKNTAASSTYAECPKPVSTTATQKPDTKGAEQNGKDVTQPTKEDLENSMAVLSEEDQVLFGKCHGMTIREARETNAFWDYVKWMKSANVHFPDAQREAQVQYFMNLYEKMSSK